MGKVRTLEVILSSQSAVYFAGQMVHGHINLELSKDLKMRDIRLVIRGKAFVHWTEQLMRGPGESRFREIRHHSATEEYVDWSQSLLGRVSEPNAKPELTTGQYTYPFQFQLPSNLPSSFEGKYGYVRYWVKVTIERPWNNDQSAKKIFTVICPVDLNREPSASAALQSKKQKRLCCLCCRSGPISAVLSVAQRGFVPGETIHINAEVTNMSRRKMAGSSVELLMTVIYHTPCKSRAMTQQIMKVKRGSIPAGDSDIWENEKLVIPPLPSSSPRGCSIIDIKYTLEMRVEPVGAGFDLNVPMEIMVGTVPLQSVVQRYLAAHQLSPPSPVRQHSSPQMAGQARSGAMADGPLRNPQYHIPPSFAPYALGSSHTHDEDDDENTRGERHYTPIYIYYTWQTEELQARRQQGIRFAA